MTATLLLLACADKGADAASGDSGTPAADSAPTDDSTPASDSAPTDSAPTDSAPTDSAPTDSAPTDSAPTDADGDGAALPNDCDDGDPSVFPGAPEACNGRDDDCDPSTGEDGVASVVGGGSHGTIAAALAAAPDGGEVWVCPGTWRENLEISRSVRLLATEGAGVTVIDGQAAGPTVQVTAGTVSLSGFTLMGGSSVGVGGGLSVFGTDPVTVEDCVIRENHSTDGGGVYAYVGAVLEIVGTEISGNTGGIGAGLFVSSDGLSGSLSVSASTVTDNTGDESGGGFFLDRVPSVTLSDSEITGNRSYDGGGLTVVDSVVDMTRVAVTGNAADHQGGGAWVYLGAAGSMLTVTEGDWGSDVEDNVPEDVYVPGVGGVSGIGVDFVCDAVGCG